MATGAQGKRERIEVMSNGGCIEGWRKGTGVVSREDKKLAQSLLH